MFGKTKKMKHRILDMTLYDKEEIVERLDSLSKKGWEVIATCGKDNWILILGRESKS